MKIAIEILKIAQRAKRTSLSVLSFANPSPVDSENVAVLEREINEISEAISILSGEGSKRLAAYLVDFDELSGITNVLDVVISDCASSADAERVLANLFEEVLTGKVW